MFVLYPLLSNQRVGWLDKNKLSNVKYYSLTGFINKILKLI
jgi:hypothetical protein